MSRLTRKARSQGAVVSFAALSLLASACGTRQSDAAIAAHEGRGITSVAQSTQTGGAPLTDGSTGGTPLSGTTGVVAPGTSGTTGGSTGGTTGTTGGSTGGTTGSITGSTGGAVGTTGGSTGGSTGGGARGGTSKASGIGPAGESLGCTSQGTPIKIGQVGTYTGFIAPVVGSSKVGLNAWVNYVNAHGGVGCHQVQLTSEDDASDSSKAAAAVQDLVENRKVVAVVGDFVPLSIQGFKSAIEQAKVPAVGGDTLGNEWNKSPYMFPQNAGVSPVLYGSYKQLVKQGKKKVAILYCVETDICPNAFKQSTEGGDAKQAGAEVVYSAQVSLTQPDYQAQCQNAKNKGADFLALYVDGSSMTRVARSCASIGYYPPIATSAIAIGASQSADPNVIKAGVSLSPGVFPWTQSDNPAQATYQNAMKTYAPNTPSDGSTAAAWVSGVLFAEAINKLGAEGHGPITVASVLKGLGLIKGATLQGLVPPLSFTAGQKSAPLGRCYYNMLLGKNGKWTAPNGSKIECQP